MFALACLILLTFPDKLLELRRQIIPHGVGVVNEKDPVGSY